MLKAPSPYKYEVTSLENDIGWELQLSINSVKAGNATLLKSYDNISLSWIEIKNAYQHQGHGTYLLHYILDHFLPNNCSFTIKVVDDNTLEFYYHAMQKRGLAGNSVHQYVVDGEHHPEIVFPAGSFNLPKKTLKPT
jgi:hypothetical protein